MSQHEPATQKQQAKLMSELSKAGVKGWEQAQQWMRRITAKRPVLPMMLKSQP